MTTSTQVGSAQAASAKAAGDSAGSSDAGQSEFSSDIIPEGGATAKQRSAEAPGAGQPAIPGEKTVFEQGAQPPEETKEGTAKEGAEAPSKSEVNQQAKGERQEQAGWQQVQESLTSINDRLDGLESGKEEGKKETKTEGGKEQAPAEAGDLANVVAEALEPVAAELEKTQFQQAHPDVLLPENQEAWTAVNSDPKFDKFSLQERYDHIMNKENKANLSAMQDQLSKAEGSMPGGSGSGSAPKGGNPKVDADTIEVGKAFGFTQKELEEEL
jgi:hypothetical protein|tara:strand:+ start:10203 stop:11015 length:813 start_codon:yes stop_codon:yes gene_type:complete